MRLRCVRGPFPNRVVTLKPNEGIVFGRSPEEGELRPVKLDSKTVSKTHCAILINENGFFIRDLQSSNGIRVNRARVSEQQLHDHDEIEIGEFSFVVEEASEKSETDPKPLEISKQLRVDVVREATAKSRVVKERLSSAPKDLLKMVRRRAKQLKEGFQSLDFEKRLLILLFVAGTLIHTLLVWPMISESRTQALRQSFQTGRTATKNLAEKNSRELAEKSFSLLDCEYLKRDDSIVGAYLLDGRGRPVCPIGVDASKAFLDDWLTEASLFRGETLDDCEERVLFGSMENCDFVTPIRAWQPQEAQYQTVGVARLRYQPLDAQKALQKLQSLGWRSLILVWLVILGTWWLIRRWLQRGVSEVAENVYLAASGAQQKVEKTASFSVMDPILSEVNRLINKLNQEVSPGSRNAADEASFLQPLLQQVLLLEERAVMIVDKDNQIIGMSRTLSEVLGLESNALNQHVVEVIQDSHLQTELMGLLNDLAASEEMMERALSAADRVLHTKALPIFLKGEFAAGLLIF